MHKRAYYAHNKSMISAKMKDKYLARVDRDNTHPHKTSSNIISGRQGQDFIRCAKITQEKIARICSAIGVVQDIFSELQDAEDDLSQQGKSGIGYTSACQATKDAKDVLSALEDVLSFILVNGINLKELGLCIIEATVQPKPSTKKKVVQTIAGFMAYLPNITILSTAPNCNIVQPKLSTKKKVVQAIAGFIKLQHATHTDIVYSFSK
ncbi:hypothetical protein BDR06DRAFT_973170, partial [Suillus hirtellus]